MLCRHAAVGLTKHVSVTDLTKAVFTPRSLALTPNLPYRQSRNEAWVWNSTENNNLAIVHLPWHTHSLCSSSFVTLAEWYWYFRPNQIAVFINCVWQPDLMFAQLTVAGRNMPKIVQGPSILLISYNDRGSQRWVLLKWGEQEEIMGPFLLLHNQLWPSQFSAALCLCQVYHRWRIWIGLALS